MATNVMEDQRRRFINHSVSGNKNICTSDQETATLVPDTGLPAKLFEKRTAPAKVTDVIAAANEKRMFHYFHETFKDVV